MPGVHLSEDLPGEKHGRFHLGHHQWVLVDGTVLERRILHPLAAALENEPDDY